MISREMNVGTKEKSWNFQQIKQYEGGNVVICKFFASLFRNDHHWMIYLWYNPIIQKLDWNRIMRGLVGLRQLSRQLHTPLIENRKDQFCLWYSFYSTLSFNFFYLSNFLFAIFEKYQIFVAQQRLTSKSGANFQNYYYHCQAQFHGSTLIFTQNWISSINI